MIYHADNIAMDRRKLTPVENYPTKIRVR